MIQIRQFQRLPALAINNIRLYSTKKDAEKVIPKNVLEDKITAKHQPNGPIVDNKPFRIKLEAGKQYSWCLCGQSKSQPLCDGQFDLLWKKAENIGFVCAGRQNIAHSVMEHIKNHMSKRKMFDFIKGPSDFQRKFIHTEK